MAYRAAIGLFNCFRIRCFKFVYSLNRADAALIFFIDHSFYCSENCSVK